MYEHPNALLERRDGGVYVALAYLPLVDLTGIQVATARAQQWVSVEKDQALDAFHHPMLYLSEAQVADLFPRTTEPTYTEYVLNGQPTGEYRQDGGAGV